AGAYAVGRHAHRQRSRVTDRPLRCRIHRHARQQIWSDNDHPLAGGRPPRGRRLLHSGMGILLGTLSLLPVGLEVFFVARGVLYGVVDQGPYDNAWGGPMRAGAWLAHFGIGLLFAAAGLALLLCIAQLHRKLGARWLRGERTGAWVVPTAVIAAAAGVVLVLAWLHQV